MSSSGKPFVVAIILEHEREDALLGPAQIENAAQHGPNSLTVARRRAPGSSLRVSNSTGMVAGFVHEAEFFMARGDLVVHCTWRSDAVQVPFDVHGSEGTLFKPLSCSASVCRVFVRSGTRGSGDEAMAVHGTRGTFHRAAAAHSPLSK